MESFKEIVYPDIRRDECIVDNFHGILVSDPYRWLEGDADSEDVKEFVSKQVEVSSAVLAQCEARDKVKQRLTELYDFPKYGCPFKKGDKYFFHLNSGLQPFSVFYSQATFSPEAEPDVVLDPNELTNDGNTGPTAVSSLSLSEDAQYLSYGVSSKGSDWCTLRLLRLSDKQLLPDTIPWTKFFGAIWTHDNKGFFYTRFPEPEKELESVTQRQSLYYHFVGTDYSEDILCWCEPENLTLIYEVLVTEDGKYIVMRVLPGAKPANMIYYCELQALEGLKERKEMLPFVKLVDNLEAKYHLVANDGPLFTFLTNKDAPRYKVARVNIEQPETWKDVIPESDKDVLDSVTCVNYQQLLVRYLSEVRHVLQLRDLETGDLLKQIPLEIGTIAAVSGRRYDSEVFYDFTGFLTPGVTYRLDLSNENMEPEVWRETNIKGFDRSKFETKQVYFPSKDGTRICMFINSRKDIKLDGSHQVMLYGYGGFGISTTPEFYFSRTVLLENCRTIWAIGILRGGGEYGREWHEAGSLGNKQNSFDDFHACAEYLIKEGYTQPSKLGIEGASHGGLLVAVASNQRPDLYGCTLMTMGPLDMLRFHKFTVGTYWTIEFGNPEKVEEFHWIYKYSPVHNVRRPWEFIGPDVQYPATMILTADRDDRVVPAHAYKWLATLQYVLIKSSPERKQTKPIFARIESDSGHAMFFRTTEKLIDEASDRFAFFLKATGGSWHD